MPEKSNEGIKKLITPETLRNSVSEQNSLGTTCSSKSLGKTRSSTDITVYTRDFTNSNYRTSQSKGIPTGKNATLERGCNATVSPQVNVKATRACKTIDQKQANRPGSWQKVENSKFAQTKSLSNNTRT